MEELRYKFNRQYLISIQYGEHPVTRKRKLDSGEIIDVTDFVEGTQELIIRPQFTININIDRGIFASTNKISLDIYNLSKETRSKIYYDSILHAAVHKKIIMYAGYDQNLKYDNTKYIGDILTKNDIQKSINGMPLIFYGRVTRAYSYRQGVNIITHIEAFDLPEKNEVDMSTEFKAGTTQKEVFERLAQSLNIDTKNLKISNDFKFKFSKDKSYSNKTAWDVAKELVASVNDNIKKQNKNAALFRLYYDYPDLVVLRDNEYIKEESVLINAETGLLSTPIREGAQVKFTSLFEPAFRCGGTIYLDSTTTETGIGGRLKVVGFKHSGTISPKVCDTLKTEFTCFMGIDKLVAQNG